MSLPRLLLRAASILAPADVRAEFLAGWRSELWYVPRLEAVRFSLGSFHDALSLRRDAPAAPPPLRLQSPLRCIAFLTVVAAAAIGVAMLLPAPRPWRVPRLQLRDVPAACSAMLLLSALILPAARLLVGPAPAGGRPAPWPSRLRAAAFFAAKLALVQPIMLCGFALLLSGLKFLPILPQLAVCAGWVFGFRWIFLDQRRRCPVCLRLVSHPVRIGAASRTFLEWFGAESACDRGHGLLLVSEIVGSYSPTEQWRTLDASWSDLFLEAAGRRPL